jgi:hypothetical protein
MLAVKNKDRNAFRRVIEREKKPTKNIARMMAEREEKREQLRRIFGISFDILGVIFLSSGSWAIYGLKNTGQRIGLLWDKSLCRMSISKFDIMAAALLHYEFGLSHISRRALVSGFPCRAASSLSFRDTSRLWP